MSHHRLTDWPTYTQQDIDAGIRRAHKLRSDAAGTFFRRILDRRYRALNVVAEPGCATC